MIVGWVGTVQNPSIGEDLMTLFQKEVAGQITIGNPADMCVKLFANNLEACILLFLGGASFGILTLFIMSLNGIVIGRSWRSSATTIRQCLSQPLSSPTGSSRSRHSSSPGRLGFCLAQSLIAEWYGAADTAADSGRLARIFLLYVLPLVAVAAVVEAFITPVIIHLVA